MYENKSNELLAEEETEVNILFDKFKKNVENFAKIHRTKLNTNSEFREKFLEMCAQIGLDPLEGK